MMNMMDRMVEGRGHTREIDMLLELTSALFRLINRTGVRLTLSYLENKSRVVQSVPLVMPQRGLYRDSCATSVL
jgi:hypothetical protein